MQQLKPLLPFPIKKSSLLLSCIIACCLFSNVNAQNQRIKCYFNHPVNNVIATGLNATYLNGSFADTIAAYINRAKYTIDIAMYNFTAYNGAGVAKIATAANAAAARGVTIRWIYNGTSATNNTGLSLLSAAIKTFPSANYTSYIMHNKFMVIDVNAPDSNDAVAQTGSYNWSDQQSTGDYNNMIFIQSKQVATAFYNEFNKMWGGTGANPDAALATFSTFKTASAQTNFTVNGTKVEVYFSPKDNVSSRLQNAINTANYDLFFDIYTFTDNTVANLIKTKFNSGLFVRGIMDNFSVSYSAYSTLNPVLGSNMIVYNGSGVYHNKIMLVDALNPESDAQVFTGSFNWTSQAQNSNDENVVVIHDAAIANQYYQSVCKDYTELGGVPCVAQPCANNINTFISNKRGSTYQWQLNTGNGFSNISDNSFYTGSSSINLTLTNAPTAWYGYQYRCLVSGTTYSDTITLKFTAYWNGSTSTAWENTANWNCGVLPDYNTDVVINPGVKFFPVINFSTTCRSVRLAKGALAALNNGIGLILTGQ